MQGSRRQVRIPRVNHTLPVAIRLLLPNLDVLPFVGGTLATFVPSEAIGSVRYANSPLCAISILVGFQSIDRLGNDNSSLTDLRMASRLPATGSFGGSTAASSA